MIVDALQALMIGAAVGGIPAALIGAGIHVHRKVASRRDGR